MKRLVTVIGIIAILSVIWSFFLKGDTAEQSVNSANEITKVESVNNTTDVAKSKSGVVCGIVTFF
jgi:plastocyanin domain-containing protein